MEKNIKDYLHLYLGCELFAKEFGIRKLTPLILMEWNEHYRHYKPILRPLSDMTEEEFIELFKLLFLSDVVDCTFDSGEDEGRFINALYHGRIIECIKIVSGDCVMVMNNDGTFSPINPQSKCQLFFLSKQFDLFGLIESGLAIDKTKQLVKRSLYP